MSKSVHDMFASIARRYDCANDVLSFGMHRWWRRRALRAAGLGPGQTVVDICTGTGDVAFAAQRLVGSGGRVLAVDFVEPMLRLARRKSTSVQDKHLQFIRGDALALPIPDKIADLAAVSFGIRNVDDPLHCLLEMKRVLRPGGLVVVLEFGQPTMPGFAQLYRLYCRWLMPLLGGLLTGNRAAYEYLPESSKAFPAGDAFLSLMEHAGFADRTALPLLSGLAYIYLGRNPQPSSAAQLQRSQEPVSENPHPVRIS